MPTLAEARKAIRNLVRWHNYRMGRHPDAWLPTEITEINAARALLRATEPAKKKGKKKP